MTLPPNTVEIVKSYLLNLQKEICETLEALDGGGQFIKDSWVREAGFGGISCVLEKGKVFEKAGVNFSHVTGNNLPPSALANRPELAGANYTALGVSLVIHPDNPFVPTSHANVRFFIATTPDNQHHWWFGGGFDLTPYYGFDEDCIHWHQTAKNACDPFGESIYANFKAWCDRYFYIKHRNEPRGIGGLFFDDYSEQNFAHSFNLMKSIGDHYLKAYAPIVERRKNIAFGLNEKNFQKYRRGRYVEFNLVYDRGTLFGLQSGGRTESILMSLPPEVSWQYNWSPTVNSAESELYTNYLIAKDWLA